MKVVTPLQVFLYNPQSSANKKPILPFSLLALGALLEGKYAYQIIDGNLVADPLRALSDAIEAHARPVLGVTVMPGPQLQQAVPLCRALKQRHPNLTIVWGGYFASQHYDVCLRDNTIDYVIRGHGEQSFVHLLDWLSDGHKPPGGMAGVVSRGDISPPVASIPHPDSLPPFNFQSLQVEHYVRRTFLGDRTLGYHSSYGCPFFCNFCAVVTMVNGRWLAQSAERVASAVRLYQKQWGVNAVEFYDNNFFVHESRTGEFADRIVNNGLAWWGEARIDTLLKYRPSTWRLMKRAGLRMIFMGAESGSAETLKRMDKGGTMSPEKTLEIARLMRHEGIIPEFSFVMGNPPDPQADVRQTIEFIRRVKQVNPQSEIIMYLYTPVPLAGDLYDNAQASGFAFPQTLDEWIAPSWLDFSQRRSALLPWVGQTLQSQIKDFERVLNAYYPTSTDPALGGLWRVALKSLAAWRYHLRLYRFPFELRALHRVLAYQRPETSGF